MQAAAGTPAAEPTSLFDAVRREPPTVPVLRVDPDLARALEPQEAAQAQRAARARCVALAPGPWRPSPVGPARGAIGLLLIDGLLCRSVCVGASCSSELLGEGDLLRPWADGGPQAIPVRPEWTVLAPTRMAVLDFEFAHAIAPWPEIHGELVDRALRRSRSQAVLAATSHIKRVDVRLLALFWHMAERWGRVTPEGIVLRVRLTHARLASLVGAQRPSVTTALTRLTGRGLLRRTESGDFVLDPSAPDELERLCRPAGQTGS